MTEYVYLSRLNGGADRVDSPELERKIKRLFDAAQLGRCFEPDDLVAVKVHFGERGQVTHVPPDCIRPLVEKVAERKANPFLTDTNTLYRGQRDNSVKHARLAYEHGFRQEKVGAPVLIADGLLGDEEIEVDIPGVIYKKVAVAPVAVKAGALLVVSHATGHMQTGLGATLKNLGMGFSGRKGKLAQHSVMTPRIDPAACTACEDCIRWCPQDTIVLKGEVAFIIEKDCIGCGECLAVCRFGAVEFDWKVSSRELQERMVEHALGAVIHKPGKVAYVTFLTSMTRDCDCFGVAMKPIMDDVGIIAGFDPVALDHAVLRLTRQAGGKDLSRKAYPQLNPGYQLDHGAGIGLGTTDYELVEVD